MYFIFEYKYKVKILKLLNKNLKIYFNLLVSIIITFLRFRIMTFFIYLII